MLREDVLDLLDKFCTVVYFPLENEENNGFHMTGIPLADGSKHNFVFINTAQTISWQVVVDKSTPTAYNISVDGSLTVRRRVEAISRFSFG